MVYLGRINHYSFHYNAFPATFQTAKYLRKQMTLAERFLWNELRNRNTGNYKFRRQHPIGKYIVDFYCQTAKLVIEIDGKIHDKSEKLENDLNRTAELERLGLHVIRFSNNEVLNEISSVLDQIQKILNQRSPPLQYGEGAGG